MLRNSIIIYAKNLNLREYVCVPRLFLAVHFSLIRQCNSNCLHKEYYIALHIFQQLQFKVEEAQTYLTFLYIRLCSNK